MGRDEVDAVGFGELGVDAVALVLLGQADVERAGRHVRAVRRGDGGLRFATARRQRGEGRSGYSLQKQSARKLVLHIASYRQAGGGAWNQ